VFKLDEKPRLFQTRRREGRVRPIAPRENDFCSAQLGKPEKRPLDRWPGSAGFARHGQAQGLAAGVFKDGEQAPAYVQRRGLAFLVHPLLDELPVLADQAQSESDEKKAG
jgi:hypothetical protein